MEMETIPLSLAASIPSTSRLRRIDSKSTRVKHTSWKYSNSNGLFPLSLARGGRMDDKSTGKRSKGMLGDVMDLFGALGKGAHIVKQKDGRV